MELSNEQLHAVQSGQPIHLTPAEIGVDCVVVRADIVAALSQRYDDSPLTAGERMTLLEQFGRRAGWEDPELDIYETYRG